MLKRNKYLLILFFVLGCCMISATACAQTVLDGNGHTWYLGFGAEKILPDPASKQPLYIAGYNSGWEVTDVLDYCEARAVWLDTGAQGVLLIGIDCIALDSGTVQEIRERTADIPNCASVHVYATHTHAGPDTLGLWGPTGIDGKNDAYMEALIHAAEEAARKAVSDRRPGALHFGQIQTENMYRDSRFPEVYDAALYHLRFAPQDGSAGIRLFFYGAHAESLRGDNTRLSRDFPGLLCDGVTDQTGDRTMFFPGAIGGLIMTRAFVSDTSLYAQKNLQITSEQLISYALSIRPEQERTLSPRYALHQQVFTVPLDNPAFLLYKFLGILNNRAVPAQSATGYGVETELSVLMLDDLALTLIPGELFPELVSGSAYGQANPRAVNPRPLQEIAQEHKVEQLLIVGLANDEVGYIVPPSDFLLNEAAPYLQKTMDSLGENHYEETNSVGPACAHAIADAFESALKALEAVYSLVQ